MSATLAVTLLLALPAQLPVEVEIQQVVPPAGSGASFGRHLALEGDVAIVGSEADVGGHVAQGVVQVFLWNGSTFVAAQPLVAADGQASDALGFAVAISGGVIAAGAPGDDVGANVDQGSVRLFRQVAGGWVEEATLLAPDGTQADSFGRAVDVHGDVAVVGAPFDDHTAPFSDEGSVHVFRRTAGAWAHEQRLVADDAAPKDRFGAKVAVHGEVLVVGVPDDDIDAPNEGSVRVYRWNGTTWLAEQSLSLPDKLQGEHFGRAVDVRGDVLAVGVPDDFGSYPEYGGSVRIFRWDGSAWLQEAKLMAQDTEVSNAFGAHVSLATDSIVVGVPNYSLGGALGPWYHSGAAYAWRHDGSSWTQETQLLATDVASEEAFGSAALSGELLLLGTAEDHSPPHELLAFDLLPDSWSWKGHALAGAAGLPVLGVAGLPLAGFPVTLSLVDAAPAAPVALVVGLTVVDASFKGGLLVPAPDAVIAGLVTTPEGRLSLSTTWPGGLPSGQLVALQAWIVDAGAPAGFAASNGLAASAH